MDDLKAFGTVMLVIVGGLAVIVFGIMYVATWIDAGYQDRQCSRFGEVTNREVQFRQFSHWSYDCYVRTSDGKWLLKDQMRDMVDGE